MTVKDVLHLFFLHPVKGLAVASDPSSERLLGFLRKERLVELASARSDLDLDISGTAERLLLPPDERTLSDLFASLPPDQTIPLIDRQGSLLRTLTRSQIEAMLRSPEPPPPTRQNPSTPTPHTTASSSQDRYRLLDGLPIPILVLNHRHVILHANETFLDAFAMDPAFVTRQQVGRFFPRLKIPAETEGLFTYSHKQWRYLYKPGLEENFLVFQEAPKNDRPASESETAADRILAGKTNLRKVTEQFEDKVIRRVYRKHKANLAQAAALLGIPEEQLKYRLQRTE